MKFNRAKPTEDFSIRLVSEKGIWEMGIHDVLFGRRVSFNRVGAHCYLRDYCAGADLLFQMELLNAVHIILQRLPDEAQSEPLADLIFPDYLIKPINLDPTCWTELKRLRDLIRLQMNLPEILPLPDIHTNKEELTKEGEQTNPS
jgi:hypothetical protein